MWRAVLVAALAINAVLGIGYAVYRVTGGGPMADVIGRTVLGVALSAVAVAVQAEVGWARWVALAYGLLFAVVVMPVWVLGVLMPMPPKAIDYAFAVAYEVVLLAIVVATLAL